MSAIARFVALVFLFALVASCSSEVAPGEKAARPAEEKQPVSESPEDARLGNLEAQYKKIESMAQTHPRDRDFILSQIDDFQKDAVGTEYTDKANNLAGEVRKKFDDDARATYEKMAAQAKKLVADRQLRAAYDLLIEYPEEFSATQWKPKIDKMIEPLEQEIDAENRLVSLRDEVNELKDKNPEAALKRLDQYPKYMRLGKRKEEWDQMYSEISARIKVIEDQRRKEEALPWEDLYTGGDMLKWTEAGGKWEVKDGCITGKYNGQAVGQLTCGTESTTWDNFIIELEFKIVSGDLLVLGVRGKNTSQGSVFDQVEFSPDEFPRGKFHSVTVEVRGKTIKVLKDWSVVSTRDADPDHTKGFICFFIIDGVEVNIRRVRIKHLK